MKQDSAKVPSNGDSSPRVAASAPFQSPSTNSQQSKFEGWAVVELMGHRREVGFVTTENYGAASLFRVDSPALPERDFVLDRPSYAWQVDPDTKKRAEHFVPAGTKVHREAVPPKSCLVGPGSIYAINPCTEDAALHAIETMIERPLILVALPKDYQRRLPSCNDDSETLEG